jgi:CheY-like chemotaxis protein
MDIQMPAMDRLEATKTIRRRGFQDPRIIVVTSLKNYREICLAAGADDFLTKPLVAIDMLGRRKFEQG